MYMYVIYSVSYSRLVLSRSQNKCIQTELNWCCERDSFDDELFTWRQTYKVGNDCLTRCVFFFFSSFFFGGCKLNWSFLCSDFLQDVQFGWTGTSKLHMHVFVCLYRQSRCVLVSPCILLRAFWDRLQSPACACHLLFECSTGFGWRSNAWKKLF